MMTDLIKDLVDSAEDVTKTELEQLERGERGTWDYEKLAEALKLMFPNPKKGTRASKKLLIDKVMKFHSTGDLKNRSYYAKNAVRVAIERNGWTPVKVGTRGGKYVIFVVEF